MGANERKTTKVSELDKSGNVDGHEETVFEEEDKMTQIIGEFGPWQLSWTFVLAIPIIMHSWQMLCNKFLTYRLAIVF